MELHLNGKVVIVTGATANIGRAIALDFASEGVKLVVTGRDEEAGDRVVNKALSLGAESAVFVKADMLEPAAPGKILAEAEKLGPVEILINNVGGNVGNRLFANSDPDSWQKDLELTFFTTLRMTHTVLPGMIERRNGHIINIGSAAAIVGDYMLPVYSAAKGAVHSFTVVLAKEVGQFGITVNCVASDGAISNDPEAFSSGSRFNPQTGMYRKTSSDPEIAEMRQYLRKGVLGRSLSTPEEVSGIVVFLASDRAGFITGQIMQVDGGSLL